jgi:protein N-terminal methyltransferase
VGAGVGRVTADVLLQLVQDVTLLEPVNNFITEAWARGSANDTRWKGIANQRNSVEFYQGTLQQFDPSHPATHAKSLGRVGYIPLPIESDTESGFDVIWCQWCLGHLSDADLVSFFKRCKKALRTGGVRGGRSLIIVKENLCSDPPEGGPRTVFDDEDSSLTR